MENEKGEIENNANLIPIDEVHVKEIVINDDLESATHNKSGKVEDEVDVEDGTENENVSNPEKQEDFTIQIEDEERVNKKGNYSYAAKKTVAQGMMDIALITANANQLRFVMEFNRGSSTFYLNMILISISILLQVGVGISLIFKGRLDLKGQSKHIHAKRINNFVVLGVFLVTIINVFIGSFTISGRNDKQSNASS